MPRKGGASGRTRGAGGAELYERLAAEEKANPRRLQPSVLPALTHYAVLWMRPTAAGMRRDVPEPRVEGREDEPTAPTEMNGRHDQQAGCWTGSGVDDDKEPAGSLWSSRFDAEEKRDDAAA